MFVFLNHSINSIVMKTLKRSVLFLSFISSLLLVSCEKSDNETELTNDLTGTYFGTVFKDGSNVIEEATCIIRNIENQTVEVYCCSENFDTTVILYCYLDGEVLRLCNSAGIQYQNGQGNCQHNGINNSWHQHLSYCNENQNIHDGYYKVNEKKFEYEFKLSSGQGSILFIGSKD